MRGLGKYNLTLNKSAIFFLPLLDIPTKYLNSLVNSYLKYSEADSRSSKNTVYLVFDKILLDEVTYKQLCANENVAKLIIPENPNLVIIQYTIPTIHNNSIDKILSGKYTKLDKIIKDQIIFYWCGPKTSNEMRMTTTIYKNFYPRKEEAVATALELGIKVNDFVEGELMSKISLLKETYFDSDIYTLVKG